MVRAKRTVWNPFSNRDAVQAKLQNIENKGEMAAKVGMREKRSVPRATKWHSLGGDGTVRMAQSRARHQAKGTDWAAQGGGS